MKLEVKMILVMLGVVLGSAGLLGVVYGFTSPVIAEQAKRARQDALTTLLPEAESFEPDTLIEGTDTSVIYHGLDARGDRIGLVFTVTPKGYAGPVETMVGLRMDSTVTAIRVASAAEGMTETPGLGANVTTDEFRDQFEGLELDEIFLTKEGGKIEAITAATISSNAVTAGVREGVERWVPYLGDGDSEAAAEDTSSTEPERVEESQETQAPPQTGS